MMKISLVSFGALAFLQSHGTAALPNSEEARDLIIGGKDAKPGEFPYFAAGLGCGGTLIHEDIVLTAAHCTDSNTGAMAFDDFVQIGGIISPSANNFTELDGEIIPTVCVLNHPDFVPVETGMASYDIALVKLARPSKAQPVKLNFNVDVPLVNERVTAVGNGIYDYFITSELPYPSIDPEYLQVFKRFHIQPEDVCSAFALEDYSPDFHLCTNDNDPVTTTCQGDSGGPLLTEDGIQVGVLSYGFNDPDTGVCVGSSPNYWSNVAKFKSFIRKGICALSYNPPEDCPDDMDLTMLTNCLDPTSVPSAMPSVAPSTSPTKAPKGKGKGMSEGGKGKGKGGKGDKGKGGKGDKGKGGKGVKGKGTMSKYVRK